MACDLLCHIKHQALPGDAVAVIARKETGRRVKFVKKGVDESPEFDIDLEEKARLLLGVKGYATNIPEATLSNAEVIAFYQNLWRVEESFRMSKHDIAARPIFHYVEDAVRAHVLICFIALMLGKYLELRTGLPIRRIHDLLWGVSEAHIKDTMTGEVFVLRSSVDEAVDSLGRVVRETGFMY